MAEGQGEVSPNVPPLVEVTGASYSYGAAPAVDGVTFRLYAGERIALVGPNGAGKSTLLRLIGGTLAPQAGQVHWTGRTRQELGRRGLARLIAAVPQSVPSGPLEDLTVEDVAALGRTPHAGWLGLRGETAADRAATTAALDAVDAAQLRARPLANLSGGERQRALLALALAQQPQLLLLDEPTRHLDPHHQVALLALVARLAAQRGVAAVAVLHDLTLAACYFPRLVLLHRGRVAADGPPAAVLTPEHVTRAYGPGLQVMSHPDLPGVPLVLPALPSLPVGSPTHTGEAALP